jgi:hypothetical protein
MHDPADRQGHLANRRPGYHFMSKNLPCTHESSGLDNGCGETGTQGEHCGKATPVFATRELYFTANRDRVRCLFLINGLGMGNSTRCYALIQRLAAAGVEVHILTSGNGLRFFNDKPEVSSLREVEAFFYAVKHRRLSMWRTVACLGELGRRASRKRSQVDAALEKLRPQFCVTDSEYTVGPMRKRGIPVIALNNSDVVVTEYLRMRNKPDGLWGQFWLVEYLDYLFHLRFADLVISPAASPLPARHPRIRRVGLIVRQEIEEAATTAVSARRKRAREFQKVTFMLSGSVLGRTGTIGVGGLPYRISVVGVEGPDSDQIRFYGKVLNNIALLADADMLLINGGFSAVSEALALRKPTVVIPVARHAEQYVNALQVVDLGFGAMVDENAIESYLRQAYRENAWIGNAEAPATIDIHGATEAAQILFRFLRSRGVIPGVKRAQATSIAS